MRGRYDIPQRWYRLKARLLGLDRLADYDRMAAVARRGRGARRLGRRRATSCSTSYGDFSPVMADGARRFFDERWIDAPVRPGQARRRLLRLHRPGVHPYVMLNYTSKRRDVLTLAHELGHGVHAALATRAASSSSARR